jgi:hypothetical protein
VTEVRIAHALAPEEVARRLAATAQKHGVEHAPEPGGRAGKLALATPFGPVEARYTVEAGALVVLVVARPPFLPEGMVRRALEDKLATELKA